MAKVVLGVREAPPGATGTGAKQGASPGEDRRHLHERALASVRFAALAVWRTQIPTNCWRQMFEDEFGHCGFRRGTKGELLAALAIQAPEARMNVQIARRHLPALRRAATELADIFQDKD